jgi:hypothetical protein
MPCSLRLRQDTLPSWLVVNMHLYCILRFQSSFLLKQNESMNLSHIWLFCFCYSHLLAPLTFLLSFRINGSRSFFSTRVNFSLYYSAVGVYYFCKRTFFKWWYSREVAQKAELVLRGFLELAWVAEPFCDDVSRGFCGDLDNMSFYFSYN